VNMYEVMRILIFENRFVVLEIFILALASLLPTVRPGLSYSAKMSNI
jgi:hypothetical protein